ncbi:MAG TPA: N,N-dimethylformamidase beta subunit family domain-containing protein, partial [Bryobacteraceae bacterium]|nr:N,N-dimethylformamidase beta subunit family domain-containing protein [Bryobacteraceae bacterium]
GGPDYSLVRWLEKQGYDVAYSSSIDTHERFDQIVRHKSWMTVAHDEYWSKEMRDNVEAARDAGVNLAFLAGNEIYWQVRFEASALGANRVEVCYKQAQIDPLTKTDPARATVRFRDPPVNRPENALMGVMYQSQYMNGHLFNWLPVNTSHWLFGGTGLTDGSEVVRIVGNEWDSVADNGLTPPGLIILARSQVCDYSDGKCGPFFASTIYHASSGAWVFAAGSWQWASGLDDLGLKCPNCSIASPGLQRFMANLLDLFNGSLPTAPFLPAEGVVNAAGYNGAGTVAPGEIVTLFGQDIGPAKLTETKIGSNHVFEKSTAGVSVLFGEQPAPMLYAERHVISVVVPWTVAGQSTTFITINRGGAFSAPATVAVAGASPGIFSDNMTGAGQGAILNQNFSINSVKNPAPPGSIVSIYATGGGLMTPALSDGAVTGPGLSKTVLPVTVRINGLDAPVSYAGSAPGFIAGAMQINAAIPSSAPSGLATLEVSVGGNVSQTVQIAIK